MRSFIYDSGVRIIYGASQMETVAQETAKLGKRLLAVLTGSFLAGGHDKALVRALEDAGIEVTCLKAGKKPLLSKVNEGVRLCLEKNIEVVLGVGGGVSMDLAKAIAFGALHGDVPMEKYLTYEVSTEGLSMLPVVTIPTNPMSGSETNADVQITLDEGGQQVGCGVGKAVFTWLNPEYVMSLPDRILAYGQMTAFAQLSINYLNLTRSPLAEHYAEASMKTIIECLRRSLADKNDEDARGTLLLNKCARTFRYQRFGPRGRVCAVSAPVLCPALSGARLSARADGPFPVLAQGNLPRERG